MKRRVKLISSAVAVLLAACASTPTTMPEVEQARARVDALARHPQASQAAGKDLTAARAALANADQALEERKDREVVAHLAYMAERRAEIGLSRIDEATARSRVTEAEAERNKVLLSARTAETSAAQASAQEQAQNAQVSREAALKARADLETLQRQYAELQAKPTERGMVVTLGDVLFDSAQATLKPGAAVTIGRLAAFLTQHEDTRIIIEGHTDSQGSDEYNSDLSRRRAQAVADAVVADGVPSTRLEVLGRGEGFPVASNETSAGRQQNRRVEIVFSNPDGTLSPTPQR